MTVAVLSGMDPWTMTPEQLATSIECGMRARALIDPMLESDPWDALHTIEPKFPPKRKGSDTP